MGFAEHSILGPRPLVLHQSFVWKRAILGTLGVLAGVAVAIAYVGWQATHIQSLIHEQDVWTRGVPALQAEVGGEVTSHSFIFNDYELEIRYVTAPTATRPALTVHDVEFEFQTFIGGPDDPPPPPIVRHLSDDPTQFALSWAVQSTTSRWAGIAFMLIVGVLIGAGIVVLGVSSLKSLSTARAAAFRSDDVLLKVLHIDEIQANGKPTGALKYTYVPLPSPATVGGGPAITPIGSQTQGETTFAKGKYPLFADPDAGPTVGAILLGVRPASAPDQMLVLRDDLYPLTMPPRRAEEARQHLAKAAPAPAPVAQLDRSTDSQHSSR